MRYFKSSKFVLLPQKIRFIYFCMDFFMLPLVLVSMWQGPPLGGCRNFMAVSVPAMGAGSYAALTRAETAEGLCCRQGQYLQVKRKQTVSWTPENPEP